MTIIIAATASSLVHAESGPPRIESLGRFSVSDVSSDGRVIVGTGGGANGLELVRWEGGQAELLGKFTEHSFAYGVSGDGAVIVGNDYNTSGVRWTRQAGLEHFGGGTATDASFDGSVIIGIPYRWTQQDGFQPLSPDPLLELHPYKMNDAGTVVVGTGRDGSEDVAFRWSADSGITFFPEIPGGGRPHDAAALTPDGSVVVGAAYFPTGSSTVAYRWTAQTGSQPLPHLSNYTSDIADSAIATAITADGQTIFGHEPVRAGASIGHEAFVWDATHGTRPLKDVLATDYGIDVGDWTFETVAGLSSDGTTLIGNGIHPDYGSVAFRAILPEPGLVALLPAALIVLATRRHRAGGSRSGRPRVAPASASRGESAGRAAGYSEVRGPHAC